MAARKAVRPLKVLLLPGAEKLAQVKAGLIDKGHDVTLFEGEEYDLVLGPNAHRLDTFNENLLALVIKSARLRAYGARGSARLK